MNPANSVKLYRFFEEPVDEWATIKDKAGKTILEKFYADQDKYAFAFQMMAYISRLTVLKNAIKNASADFQQSANPITFSIEGNIGTGKSTLVKHLQQYFNGTSDKQEKTDAYNVIMTERSVFTDCYVFAQMLYDDKKIEDVEYAIYMKWFDEFIKELPPMAFIYIRADPAVSLERVTKRAREGESIIPLAYLENCHKYHEEWLLKNVPPQRLLIIDANEDINASPALLLTWIKKIEDFVASF
jgi:deoxycitidine kinase/deoxyguanosine kinase